MADGPWYTSSGYGDANITVAARTLQLALSGTIKNLPLLNEPWVRDLLARDQLLGQLMGELGVSIGLVTLGTGKMSAVAEGTAATATDFSVTNSTTVSPARRGYARKVSDFAASVQAALMGPTLPPSVVATLILEALRVWLNDIIDRVAATFTTATYQIGTSGLPLSWGAMNDGILAMQDRGVDSGVALGLISLTGAQNLMADMLGLGGAVQWAPEAQQGIAQLTKGARIGSFWGVPFYLNSELDASGGDTYGGIVTAGSHLLKHQRVPLPAATSFVVADTGFITIEGSRPGGGVTTYEYVSHNAIAVLEQARFAGLRHLT